MKINKKLISFLLAVAMILGMCPVGAYAEEQTHLDTCLEDCAGCDCFCHQSVETVNVEDLCPNCDDPACTGCEPIQLLSDDEQENPVEPSEKPEEPVESQQIEGDPAPVCTKDPATCPIEGCTECKAPVDAPVCGICQGEHNTEDCDQYCDICKSGPDGCVICEKCSTHGGTHTPECELAPCAECGQNPCQCVKTCEHCGVALTENTQHEADCLTNCTCTPVEGVHQAPCVLAPKAEDKKACNCGENAPENLAHHADSCPRKQYIRKLFEGKSAEDIYAQWASYDAATRSDLLQMLQVWDNTKYEALKKLVAGSDLETNVGDMSLKLQGVPVGVSLSAATVSTKEYHEDVFDIVENRRVVFALDINLTEGAETWQPEAGKKVTVTLDASSLGLPEGKRIGILHEHDGVLKDLGISAITNGKLTFVTDGFSVFYGYTVDFEYDGTWHSISGGSDIFLSELFLVLNIDRDVNDVSSVEFTDDSLLRIECHEHSAELGGGKYWRLVSLAPFDTEEILTVTFKNGEVLEINVYDATNWQDDDIYGDQTWHDGDISGARTVREDCTITIADGATVTFTNRLRIEAGVEATIRCEGSATLVRTSSFTSMFDIQGGKLTIEAPNGTITIDGNEINSTRAAFTIAYGRDYWGYLTDHPSDLILKNVVIKDCYSISDDYGAAISTNLEEKYKTEYSLQMTNCIVENCKAPHGSALYFFGDSYGRATIKNCVFKNCIATGSDSPVDSMGGTIRSNGNNGSIVIFEQCIFDNNKSGYDFNGNLRTTACCFGAGIYWNAAAAASKSEGYNDPVDSTNEKAKMYIYDCQITNNIATNRGGGIFNEAAMEIGSRFQNTESYDKLPVWTNNTNGPQVTDTTGITGTLIYNNTAKGYSYSSARYDNCGGGIMIPTYAGGADESQSMNVSLEMGKGVFILNNHSKNGGGFAMEVKETSDKPENSLFSVKWNGAVIENNTATENGGGIYVIMKTTKYTSQLDLVKGTIANNTAKNGAGIYVKNTSINMGTSESTTENSLVIEGNEASKNGGGIYLVKDSTYSKSVAINIANGMITNNQAGENGGGIYQNANGVTCTVSGAGKIMENTAANGGGIYVDAGTLKVEGGIISENTAACSHAGTNHICQAHGTNTAQGSTSGVGGGVYVNNGTLTMTAATGSSVGLYGNIADFAADDAYASGSSTNLSLPEVTGMPLNGTPYAKVDGWYIDYCADDSQYSSSPYSSKTNPGRYRSNKGERITAGTKVEGTSYYCLTLGRTPALVIEKRVPGEDRPNESFTFVVKNAENEEITYSENGVTKNNVVFAPADFIYNSEEDVYIATKTIPRMPVDTITVTESLKADSRFHLESADAELDNNANLEDFTITFTMTDEGEKVTFTNDWALADLMITKKGAESIDEYQSFIFKVTGPDEYETLVTIYGNGQVTLKDLPVGEYTVAEAENWSWRYDATSYKNGDIDDADGSLTTGAMVDLKTGSKRVLVTNTRDQQYWLDGNSFCKNIFGNGTIIKSPVPSNN